MCIYYTISTGILLFPYYLFWIALDVFYHHHRDFQWWISECGMISRVYSLAPTYQYVYIWVSTTLSYWGLFSSLFSLSGQLPTFFVMITETSSDGFRSVAWPSRVYYLALLVSTCIYEYLHYCSTGLYCPICFSLSRWLRTFSSWSQRFPEMVFDVWYDLLVFITQLLLIIVNIYVYLLCYPTGIYRPPCLLCTDGPRPFSSWSQRLPVMDFGVWYDLLVFITWPLLISTCIYEYLLYYSTGFYGKRC